LQLISQSTLRFTAHRASPSIDLETTAMRRLLPIALLSVLVSAAPAAADIGLGTGFAFFDGLIHPLMGIDHILAMVGVGLWAGLKGGSARWLWPLAFVTVMSLGGVAGLHGIGLPHTNALILASVIGLGAVIGLGLLPPVAVGAALCGLFAIAHGHSHGTELPVGASASGYMLGFLLATAALHAGGVGLGFWASRHAHLARTTGAIILAGAAYLGLS
jgi:urease accessory protein